MSFHVREQHLFEKVDFIGHSGDQLHWKIECDAITSPEWECLATMIMEKEKRPFQAAIGIPRGGLELSRWLNNYSTQDPKDPYDYDKTEVFDFTASPEAIQSIGSKKEGELGALSFGKLFNVAKQRKQGFSGLEM